MLAFLHCLYNWGRFQAGVSVGSYVSDNGSLKTTDTGISLLGQINFIENNPGNNFIPFVQFGLSSLTSEVSATSSAKGTGGGSSISLGAYFLPFGDIFAIELGLGVGKADFSFDSINTKAKIDTSSFSVGWSVTY